MKWIDIFKKLGISLDEDVDMTEESTSEENEGIKDLENEVKNSGDEKHVEKETTPENNVEQEEKKLKLNYDKNTGLFDLHDIEDEEVKAVLKIANDTVKSNANKALIDKAVSDKLGTIKLNKGITNDVVLKMLDLTNVKVSDGSVTGLDDAFNNLKTTQSGLFMNEETVGNPLSEGFNPKSFNINGASTNGIPNSINEAFAMME